MICHALTNCHRFGEPYFHPSALVAGSRMNEYLVRPGCLFSSYSLASLHYGKEDYILNNDQTNVRSGAYVMGWEQERQDLYSMLEWSSDIRNCDVARKRGIIN